ncbi:MAG: S1/P1 nuclease [Holophaga sp.]
MKHLLAPAAILLLAGLPLSAWGREGHALVATLALKALPPEVAVWFQGQEDFFKEHSSDPDHWRQDRKESPRHYLNAEDYGGPAGVPFDVQEAMAKVGAERFQKNGQAPWVIQDRLRDLVDAFKKGDRAQVAYAATILGHYVADLHVPLHTTDNHNGQNTGQKGVHSRWETGLVGRFASLESLQVMPAVHEAGLFKAPWVWMTEAYALVPKLLEDDRAADRTSPEGPRGKNRGEAYWAIFGSGQTPAVRQQLSLAGKHLAQMIQYAWLLAGKPKP